MTVLPDGLLTACCESAMMEDCDDATRFLHEEAREHIALAVMAEGISVSAMHIDLAAFAVERASAVDEFCADDD